MMERQPDTEYILSLSYGKDSIACLFAIEQLGWPLDRIVHAEVWATDTIPADPPPMVEFKAKADAFIQERYGIQVEHIRHKMTFEEMFYRKTCRGKFVGTTKGWPIMINSHGWCKNLKITDVLNKWDGVQYVGIACDETRRHHVLNEKKRSPLVETGWTEKYCRQICEEYDLLSPIYTTATRGGCWFCNNQGIDQLRLLRKTYPEYWELMLKWDKDSPVTFKADGHTLHDYEARFRAEDAGLVPTGRNFRWEMIGRKIIKPKAELPGQICFDDLLQLDTPGAVKP